VRSNLKIGRISGIEIGLHYSWFMIAALIVVSLGRHFRQMNQGWSTHEVWIAALFTAVLFFLSLLLHELAHSLVAQKRGLKVSAITLFALGGVSQIQEDSTDAKTEFWVAIAGPIASLTIGLACLGTALGLGWQGSTEPQSAVTGVLVWLGYINLGLAAFNMIPGFPLDGGRILRSILWAVTKNPVRSTRIAARAGQAVASLFILDGIWKFGSGAGLGGLWTTFIGWFLLNAARASYDQVKTTAAAVHGMRVSDMMSRGCVVVDRATSVQQFVDTYLLRTARRCFAVADRGRIVGLVTRAAVTGIPRDRWDTTTVGDAMQPLEQMHAVTPDTPVVDAVKLVLRYNANGLPVVADGRLQGVVFRSQLAQLLRARSRHRSSEGSAAPHRAGPVTEGSV
jgi:Zn-dependent protease/CBS domain-containing protein